MVGPFAHIEVLAAFVFCLTLGVTSRRLSMCLSRSSTWTQLLCWIVPLLLTTGLPASSQQLPTENSAAPMALYQALSKFDLGGGVARAERLVLKRDRAEITFDGMFYLEPPLAGGVRGAVFLGKGNVHANVPNSVFEKDNLYRMLKADAVDSTFSTAVLRFSDDTLAALGLKIDPGSAPPPEAQKLAAELSPRLIRETGANVPARMVVSILDRETPGFFLAQFDKGSRGRFYLLLDHQGRLPMSNFGLNGGEKGLFFAPDWTTSSTDVWMAFFSLENYEKGVVEYSDVHDLVSIRRNTMQVDLRDWKHMRLETRMEMVALADGVRAIPLQINETLSARDNERFKKALRLKAARLTSGQELSAIQEDWDGSVTLLLSSPLAKGQVIEPILELEGEFLLDPEIRDITAYYVRSDCWYPRHGYLNRSVFDITFRHKKKSRVISIGDKVREEPGPEGDMVTEWRMDTPVALVTFALGDFVVHTDKAKMEDGRELELDFYTASGYYVKPDFILAELNNSVRYFSALFGPYPYRRFGATFHPYQFGQGFPTMLMLPKSDRESSFTYSFIAHETSHQWWGDLVAWRSYRDQWLSEGFANYSGVLYTATRDKERNAAKELLQRMHDRLLNPPGTLTGIGKGRLVDIGPIVLGHRLSTRESFGAYTALIYDKGALVLRMLHFLFTDPSTGNDKAFFDMMRDFVQRHQNGWASTESFRAVANEHFLRTPIAQKYQLKDLNWFFGQWVYQSALPTYELSYGMENQPDGSVVLRGTLAQRNVPQGWFMPLPLLVHFGKDSVGRVMVYALGPETPVAVHLPKPPERVELDPDRWILSEKTRTSKNR